MQLVAGSCQVMCKNTVLESSPLRKILGVEDEFIHDLISKIVTALPNKFFFKTSSSARYDLLALISRRIILFQTQEDIDDPLYPIYLINFIHDISTEIDNRYFRENYENNS